ncbi:hypothetical protein [Deinococcus koreensis]|uniref:Uncharacterized protein n=1 Tax=Deinococcus koreensis TaxID=2054903 RepID=A0A2K3UXN0_9DEIO|nr:hypothetical protein [Deinococcus koreensis]PNY81288.1 hypothetical protein CVO96_07710 [Deinococcus koreensis]
MRQPVLTLLAGLLAACAYTPPQEPFRVGDVFRVEGPAVTGPRVSQRFTLSGGGRLRGDRWEYDADGPSARSALLLARVDGGLVGMVDMSQAYGPGSDGTVTACFVAPAAGWKSAEGLLVRDSAAVMLELAGGLSGSGAATTLPALRALVGEARSGTCTLTRD